LHQSDLIHRDIKPGNLMIVWQTDGSPLLKVLDFGSVKVVSAARTSEQRLTQIGEVLGTASYTSPEQAAGEEVDARSDIFSAGRVLFELTNHDGMVPAYLAPIVARALAHSPKDRYQTANELRAALEKISEETVSKATADVDVSIGQHEQNHRIGQAVKAASLAATTIFVVGTTALLLSDSALCAVMQALNVVAPQMDERIAAALGGMLNARPLTRRYLAKTRYEHIQARDPQHHTEEWEDAAFDFAISEAAAGNRAGVAQVGADLEGYWDCFLGKPGPKEFERLDRRLRMLHAVFPDDLWRLCVGYGALADYYSRKGDTRAAQDNYETAIAYGVCITKSSKPSVGNQKRGNRKS
jgi:hypothetical protein